MRILYFSMDYSPHDYRFLSAMVDGGHKTYYMKLVGNLRQTEDRPVPSQVELVHWAGGNGRFRWRDVPRLAFDLRRVLKKIKPDVVHAGPIQTCAFLAALAGAHPLLTMSWGFDLMQDTRRGFWMQRITRYVLHRSHYFTSDAFITRDKAVHYGMNPDRATVIPWGVDLGKFMPGSKNTARRRMNEFTILCNRSWEPRYGVDVLARAYIRVAKQNENVSLILLGGGSQAQVIRSILLSGGVIARVHFGGYISHSVLPDWYRRADLYVSPSHVDGTSVSLLEALACGLPVLVSDIPGNKEWVNEDVNGWLFPDGDQQALADKITEIIAQRKRLPEVGRAARKSAQERADWTRNAALLMQVYETTVKL